MCLIREANAMRAYKSNRQQFGFQAVRIQSSISVQFKIQQQNLIVSCRIDLFLIKIDLISIKINLILINRSKKSIKRSKWQNPSKMSK